jgi:hypothetical protein
MVSDYAAYMLSTDAISCSRYYASAFADKAVCRQRTPSKMPRETKF